MSEVNPTDVAEPTTLKLRGSCDACSISKVRCDKTKPICSRCARRKITCQYVATKRVGRKQNSARKVSIMSLSSSSKTSSVDMSQSLTITTQSPSQVLPPADMGMDLTLDTDVDMFMSNTNKFDYSVFSTTTSSNTSSMEQTPSPQTSSSTATTTSLPIWDNFLNFLPVDPTLAADLDSISVLEGNSVPPIYDEFQDFFTTTSVVAGDHNADSHDFQEAVPVVRDHPFNPLEDRAFVDQLITSPQQRAVPRANEKQPRGELDVSMQSVPSTTSGPCIARALTIMRHFFPNSLSKSCSQARQESNTADTSVTPYPTFESIISNNETVIDACITILKCACSDDGCVLAVLSLIAFKVLAWYAAAVLLKSEPGAASSPDSGYGNGGIADDGHTDESFAARMAAQLVLGKLHLVQRLINQLSTKLRLQAARCSPGETGSFPPTNFKSISAGVEGGSQAIGLDSVGCLSISGTTLQQLELDLRKRLKRLSVEIIGVLKRD